MATKKIEQPKPRILVHDFVRYYRNGPMQLTATFVAQSVFSGKEERDEKTITVPQPKRWTTDEPVLDAVRAEYPGADVLWLADAEPT